MSDGPAKFAVVEKFDPAVPEVVAMCEQLLAWAKSGELRSMAYVTVKRGGLVGSAWHNEDHLHTLISGFAILQHRLIEDRHVVE